MKYFAYGSNMNHAQMAERCKGSKFIKRALLKDYRFVYDGYAGRREGAVANIVQAIGSEVWGALFEISEENLRELDDYEGYPTAYQRKEFEVQDDNGHLIRAIAYYRTDKTEGNPSKGYEQIVTAGAEDGELPGEYISRILKRSRPSPQKLDFSEKD